MDRRKQRFKKRTAVTKEQALNFLCANEAADQNRETHRCGERNGNGITTFVNPVRKLANFSELLANGTAGFSRFLELMRTEPAMT